MSVVRLEYIPILVGAIVALFGIGLVADALVADDTYVATERRRRVRAPRHPRGQLLVGLGVLALAAALIGSDRWRWGTVAVLAGLVLVTVGALLNRHFLAELFSNRGALRRSDAAAEGTPSAADPRTERVVRRRAVPEGLAPDHAPAPGAVPDAPPGPPGPPVPPAPPAPGGERRAAPRGGDGPRRIR